MLVLSRRTGERIRIGDSIVIEFVRVQSDGKVRVAIDAPPEVEVHREEVYFAKRRRDFWSRPETGEAE